MFSDGFVVLRKFLFKRRLAGSSVKYNHWVFFRMLCSQDILCSECALQARIPKSNIVLFFSSGVNFRFPLTTRASESGIITFIFYGALFRNCLWCSASVGSGKSLYFRWSFHITAETLRDLSGHLQHFSMFRHCFQNCFCVLICSSVS